MATNMDMSMDDDDDEEQGKAYSSITNAPVKPELSLQGRVQGNAAASGSGQTPMDPKVAEFVSRTLAGQNSTPKEPDELTSSPEYQQFLKKEGDLGQFRQAQTQASTMANLGQAFAQAAQGANAPTANSELYKSIGQQGQNISKELENEENRRQNVIRAIENRKGREDVAKLRSESQQQTSEARMQAQKEAADAKKDTALDKNYTGLRHDLETFRGNQAAQQAALKVQNADTALAIVKDKDPNTLTTQDLHILAEEMGKIASGGVPTESGVKSLMPNNLQTKLAEMQSFLTSKPTDAQAAEYIKHNMQYLEEMKNVAKGTLNDYRTNVLKGYKNRVKGDDYEEAMKDYQIGKYAPQPMPKTQMFPMQVTKGGQVATISNADELKEASADGWK